MPLDKDQQRSLNALLIEAVEKKNAARVESCLQHGAQTDCVTEINLNGVVKQRSLGHQAYYHYQAEVMRMLVHSGLSLETKDSVGNTVLACAVQDGKLDIVQKLLELRANPLAMNNRGNTVLDLARVFASQARFDNADSMRAEKIIDALLNAMPILQQGFNGKAAASQQMDTKENMVVRKPIVVTPKKSQNAAGGQDGFKL